MRINGLHYQMPPDGRRPHGAGQIRNDDNRWSADKRGSVTCGDGRGPGSRRRLAFLPRRGVGDPGRTDNRGFIAREFERRLRGGGAEQADFSEAGTLIITSGWAVGGGSWRAVGEVLVSSAREFHLSKHAAGKSHTLRKHAVVKSPRRAQAVSVEESL